MYSNYLPGRQRQFFWFRSWSFFVKRDYRITSGTISIQSKKGNGTTFHIILPLEQGHNIPENQKVISDFTISPDHLNQYTAEIRQDNTHKLSGNEQDGYRNEESLLIIEENEELLEYLKNSFKEDYEVFTANSNSQGLKLAYEMIPDLIITDITLTEKSSVQITSALKNDIRTSHVPVIILAADGNEEHKISEIKQMADLYMTKPFN